MMVRMNPYLVMDGNAKEGIAFYETAFDRSVDDTQEEQANDEEYHSLGS